MAPCALCYTEDHPTALHGTDLATARARRARQGIQRARLASVARAARLATIAYPVRPA